jgi:hypothetical protein
VEVTEVRVLPCENEEGVIRRARSGRCASVGEVSPVAWVMRVVVVIVNFVIGNYGVRGRGCGVEFGY